MDIYTVGFAFRAPNFDDVLLVRKKKPPFLAGKLNGIGGSVEKDETPLFAQCREFEEETGVSVMPWNLFAVLHRPYALVYAFSASLHGVAADHIRDKNDIGEEIVWAIGWQHLALINYFESVPMLLRLAILKPLETVYITLGDVPRGG